MTMPESDVTLGELFRLIQAQGEAHKRQGQEQSADLAEIKQEVRATNGTVADLKTRVSVLEANMNHDTTARVGAAGGLLAALSGLLWELWKRP